MQLSRNRIMSRSLVRDVHIVTSCNCQSFNKKTSQILQMYSWPSCFMCEQIKFKIPRIWYPCHVVCMKAIAVIHVKLFYLIKFWPICCILLAGLDDNCLNSFSRILYNEIHNWLKMKTIEISIKIFKNWTQINKDKQRTCNTQ